MDSSLLATKLHAPPVRSDLVRCPRLTGRLDESPERKPTLVSAPADFGQTTLLSERVDACARGGSTRQLFIRWRLLLMRSGPQ